MHTCSVYVHYTTQYYTILHHNVIILIIHTMLQGNSDPEIRYRNFGKKIREKGKKGLTVSDTLWTVERRTSGTRSKRRMTWLIENFDRRNISFFSFEFSALDYTDSKKNQYAYKLEGLDEDWVYSKNRHFANYTDVQPGQYVFRAMGSNNDGIWNEEGVSLVVNISPPWWQSGWAYALYVMLFGLTLYCIRRFELKRTHLKNELEKHYVRVARIDKRNIYRRRVADR